MGISMRSVAKYKESDGQDILKIRYIHVHTFYSTLKQMINMINDGCFIVNVRGFNINQ